MSRVEYLLMGPPTFTGRFGVNGHVDGPVQTHTGVDVRKSCRGRWVLMVCVWGGEGNGVEQGESSQNAIYTCLKLSKNLIKIKKKCFYNGRDDLVPRQLVSTFSQGLKIFLFGIMP